MQARSYGLANGIAKYGDEILTTHRRPRLETPMSPAADGYVHETLRKVALRDRWDKESVTRKTWRPERLGASLPDRRSLTAQETLSHYLRPAFKATSYKHV